MKMAPVALGCIAALLVCGCGSSAYGGAEQQPARSDGAGVATKPPSPRPVTSAATPFAQHLLTHRTRRPPHVRAQFEFVGGAGPGACFEVGNRPQVRVLVEPFSTESKFTGPGFNERGIATYGQPVDVCFDGLGKGPISVTVSGPNGFEMSGALPPLPATRSYHYHNEWSSFDWVPAIEPSWPLGNYVITARGGGLIRRHMLTLVPPDGPGLRVLGPSTDWGHNSVPPNSFAKLYLTGFDGNSDITIDAYRRTGFGPHAHFFSSASVPIPASGNTAIEIPTGPVEGHREGPTFIITTRYQGQTPFAAFTVFKERKWPGQVVGTLPNS
jgi:hypothetical protein